MENFRLATKTDAPLLAGLREKVWKETYEGIYPQEMLDTFDRILHEKDPAKRKSGQKTLHFTPCTCCPAIRAKA